MRIVIVSDTHGRISGLEEALLRSKPVDWLLHLGDVEGQHDEIAELAARTGCRVAMVRGNNDFFSPLQDELELEICGIKILMTHGHMYGVSIGEERIKNIGVARKADVVMFGHTHCPYIETDEKRGITLLNPGSIAYPRQAGRQHTYIIMEIGRDKTVNYEIKHLD